MVTLSAVAFGTFDVVAAGFVAAVVVGAEVCVAVDEQAAKTDVMPRTMTRRR
jgi:hypothetical protein